MKVLFCVLFLVGVAVNAQQAEDYAFPDYWQDDDYDNLYNYNEAENSDENADLKLTNQAVDELLQINEDTVDQSVQEDKNIGVEDYQIEDNRSASNENVQDGNDQNTVQEEVIPNVEQSDDLSADDELSLNDNLIDDKGSVSSEQQIQGIDDILQETGNILNVDTNDFNGEKSIDDILQETRDILDLDKNNFDDEKVEDSVQGDNSNKLEDLNQVIEETQKLLDESSDAFELHDDVNADKGEMSSSTNIEEIEQEKINSTDIKDEKNVDVDKEEQASTLEESLTSDLQEIAKQEQKNSEEDAFDENYDDNSKSDDQDKTVDDALQSLLDGFEEAEEEEQNQSDEDLFSENEDDIEEDTPQKVYADLNADLDKLFETLDKLTENNPDEGEDNGEGGDANLKNDVQDYEDKFNKPFNEDAVLAWRDAEADDADAALGKDNVENMDEISNSAENTGDQLDSDDYEVINDSNLSEIFKEHAEVEENKSNERELAIPEENNLIVEKLEDSQIDNNDAQEILDYNENEEVSDNEPNADDDIDSVIKQIFTDDIKMDQPYGNDGLVDENQPKNEDAEEIETTTKVETEQKSKIVNDLSSAELTDLMLQFADSHKEELNIKSDDFKRVSEPIHVIINTKESTVITSPNYPEAYPTGQTIDWIIEGSGTGIEFNMTDFAVNGASGDYLLVKPGGIDETGTDGLIFSYRLKNERRYRFTDVNRMFVRFESKSGDQTFTGFSFSVKLMWPLPERPEEIPEAEPVITAPRYTLTLNLAGLTLPQFMTIKETFKVLVAEMASAYIRDNNMTFGSAPPLECLQVTRTAVCNIQWPDYDTCVEVTFGIPLQYEDHPELDHRFNEEDLNVMWTNYTAMEQYASRLREMGITEYVIPDDRSVLTVWLVIAGGVVISMAMLAFALWRFSCFEDYTRMRAFSDTDSIRNEKRNLDLYPTPHQTLPPLYSESDYKWADEKYDDSTRVDIGGFSNKSYVRDDLFEYDSDEDVITTRDRSGVSPRDIYQV